VGRRVKFLCSVSRCVWNTQLIGLRGRPLEIMNGYTSAVRRRKEYYPGHYHGYLIELWRAKPHTIRKVNVASELSRILIEGLKARLVRNLNLRLC
jgi:hypothetical protein